MADPRPRVRVPKTASAGEVVEIKTLISHDMESGQRKDRDGNTIPRDIINHFTATFNGTTVFETDLHPAISANPYLSFYTRIPESGTFEFAWTDDNGETWTETAEVAVE
jgi:sulfur-oxidizing protein SoxZ